MKVPKCPKHNVNMVVKIARYGEYQGQKFFVCPMYPYCKMHVNYELYLKKTNQPIESLSIIKDDVKSLIKEGLLNRAKKHTQDYLRNRKKEPRYLFNPYRRNKK